MDDATARGVTGESARALSRSEADYPARLLDLRDPPAILFARGTLPSASPPAVAMVGTRGATGYGLRIARSIATSLARAGVSVVSGLARGIDGASHEAALAAGGRTVAVLGTGLDREYPRSHRALQRRIGEEGLLLSELPAASTGHPGSFPRRNRLIAALADVVLIVEAGEKSGALITAEYALELGRTVACVPNAIDVPSAQGSNALLKRGAEPVLHPDDVLELLDMRAAPTPSPSLDGDAATCWDAIRRGAIDVAQIAAMTGLSHRAVMSAVTALEIEALVTVDMLGGIRACDAPARPVASR